MRRIIGYNLAFLLTMASFSGCIHQREHDTRRVWLDWNTLGQWAFFIEQKDHKPYHASRVGNFRWQYGKDPGHQYAFPYYIPPHELAAMETEDPLFPVMPAPIGSTNPTRSNMFYSNPPRTQSPLLGPPEASMPEPVPPLPGVTEEGSKDKSSSEK